MGFKTTVPKKDFERIAMNTQRSLEEAGKRLLASGLAVAHDRVPVDSGELDQSIHGEVAVKGKQIEVMLGADADHAAYVELGTENQHPQPFIQPAMDEIKKRLPGEVDKAVKEGSR